MFSQCELPNYQVPKAPTRTVLYCQQEANSASQRFHPQPRKITRLSFRTPISLAISVLQKTLSNLSPPDMGDLVDPELLERILLFGDITKPSKPGEIVNSYDAFFLLSNAVTGLCNLQTIQYLFGFPIKLERGLSSTREGGTYRRAL